MLTTDPVATGAFQIYRTLSGVKAYIQEQGEVRPLTGCECNECRILVKLAELGAVSLDCTHTLISVNCADATRLSTGGCMHDTIWNTGGGVEAEAGFPRSWKILKFETILEKSWIFVFFQEVMEN